MGGMDLAPALASLVLLLAPATGPAGAPPAAAGTGAGSGAGPVTLRVAFPAGIEGTRRGRTEQVGVAVGSTLDVSARLRIARADDGWRLGVGLLLGEQQDEAAPLTLVTRPDGTFLRVDGVEPFRDAVASSFTLEARLLMLLPAFQEARGKFSAALVEAERVAYDEDVGRWAGRKLLPGASETEARQPEQPGALPVTARFGLRGPVPCPGGAPDGCLELWWSEEVDAAVRARACAARDRLAAWKHEETTTELVVLAEAATLLPRRARSLTTTRSACPEGFLPGEVTSKAEREYEWRR